MLEVNRDGDYVLWFEADLYDQLQITEILARLAGLGVAADRITLICIGEHPGIARFGGLGELTTAQLRELPHTNAAARLTPAALDLATHAWTAFRAPSPHGLGVIAATRLGELRFLGEAFDRLSREYPATRDGLSLTERRVLAAIADGAPDAGTVFLRAWARETRPYLGDTSCFDRIQRMAEGPRPLLRLDPPGRPVKRTTSASLTSTGERVLAGQDDQIALNGIDRWIGGVHLRGHHVPWRWDDGTEAIVGK
jgi:DNA-binding transcriptional LysR family regulator